MYHTSDLNMLPTKHNSKQEATFQLYELKVKIHIIKMISSFSEIEKGQLYLPKTE